MTSRAYTLIDGSVIPSVSSTLAHLDAAFAVAKRDVLVFRSYRMRFAARSCERCTITLFYYLSDLCP